MVFEYMEFDLTGILNTPEIRFTHEHIKSWSHQLLGGIHYMHKNKVIHRDLKASNLLINKKGELKIADWGLARSWNSDMKRLTNRVITLWYRPPELLLGCLEYTPKIDMWSAGCIIAEMFRRSGLFKADTERFAPAVNQRRKTGPRSRKRANCRRNSSLRTTSHASPIVWKQP